ncbi:MAG: tRNA (adenosine(37)-N6)-threonylcarbamoyltransferase complex ATPase subunit type 1 TsaE [Patescibacteria group bacterium]
MRKFIAHNEKDMLRFATAFAKTLRGGEVILLVGDLGSGKTTFVKGLARELGVKQKIKSPTFSVMNMYTVGKAATLRHLIHIDTYRLPGVRALEDIGIGDWLGRKDSVVVVEWGEKLKPALRGKKYIEIRFHHGKKEEERVIRL